MLGRGRCPGWRGPGSLGVEVDALPPKPGQGPLPTGFRIPGARGVPSPLKPRTLGAGEGLSPRYKIWALSIVSTLFDSQAASELCPCRRLGSKWEPGLMTLGLLGSLMISCSRHKSKVGVGSGASGNFRLQRRQSRLGPWLRSAPAQAGSGLSYLRPGGSAAGRAMGLQLGSCTLWTSVSPAAHTAWTH